MPRIPQTTAFLSVLAALTLPATAGPVEEANAAYQRGDYRTAVKLLRPLVDQGNADAQDILAIMYYVGQGLPQNRAEAIRLYRLAAEQGNAHAQDALGFAYQNGVGVQRDVGEAAKWFRKSADQDNLDAQFNLGEMYELGEGVPPDLRARVYVVHAGCFTRYPALRDARHRARRAADESRTIAQAQKLAREWKPVAEPKRE